MRMGGARCWILFTTSTVKTSSNRLSYRDKDRDHKITWGEVTIEKINGNIMGMGWGWGSKVHGKELDWRAASLNPNAFQYIVKPFSIPSKVGLSTNLEL